MRGIGRLSPPLLVIAPCEQAGVLYEEHGSALLRFALSVARNHDRARDAVQESFLRYCVQVTGGASIESPRPWLFRVVFNYLMDTAPEAHVSLDKASHLADPGCGPEAAANMASLQNQLEQLLSPRELSCVQLRVEGLSYDEIASVLGIRMGTVGAVLTAATRKVSKIL